MTVTTFLAALALGLPQMPAEALDNWAAPAGLQVVRLHAAEGDVVVYLPSRLEPGCKVSGSVFVEPTGVGVAEISRNRNTLGASTIDVQGTSVRVDDPQFTVSVPEDGSAITMTLVTGEGGSAVRGGTTSSALGTTIDEPAACPVVEQDTAIRVVGKFDGLRETTLVWLDDQPAGILAEGTRDCVVSTMGTGLGAHRLRIKEGAVESEHMVNVVRVDVKPPASARPGKVAGVEVAVDGLTDAETTAFPLSVVVSNNMPKLFPFGGLTQVAVDAAGVRDGRWTGKIEFKPKGKGDYAMCAHLVCDAFLKRIGL